MASCCKRSHASRLARLLFEVPPARRKLRCAQIDTCVGVIAVEDACQLAINEHGIAGGAVPQRGQREHVPLAVLQNDLAQRDCLVCEVADELPHLHAT